MKTNKMILGVGIIIYYMSIDIITITKSRLKYQDHPQSNDKCISQFLETVYAIINIMTM